MSPEPQEESQGRIEIQAPKKSTFEYPPGVWEDLETYLFSGFLISHAEIQGVSIVFKTLNANELRNISFMRTFASQSLEMKNQFRTLFIAHSVLMINGQSFLHRRSDNIDKLVRTIGKFSSAVQDRILLNLSGLNQKVQRLHPLVEPYAYETRSRFRWQALKTVPLNSSTATGIPGTDDLGLNICQSTWVSLNRIIDTKDQIERDWANAKFIGGCFVGKGMRSIDERDKTRLEAEESERAERKAKVIREYLNRDPSEEKSVKETVLLPDGRMGEVVSRYKASSADELAKELSAALNNEKDAHDLAVEKHLNDLRDRNNQIEQDRQQVNSLSRSMIMQDSGTMVLSKADAEDRIKRMRESILENAKRMTPDLAAPDA